jgi:hypothetical protein
MSKYDRQADMVKRLLDLFGNTTTMTRIGSVTGWTDTFDPIAKKRKWTLNTAPYTVQYTAPTGSPHLYDGSGALTGFKLNQYDGTIIQFGDSLLTLTNEFPEPQPLDTFEIGDKTYKYVNTVQVIYDGETVLYYRVQVR